MKIIIILLLGTIIYCLGSAIFFMLKGKQGSTSMAKALTWRISLSLLLFILLIVAYFLGWISPNPAYLLP